MKTYSTFIFESYDFNENMGRITLRYALDNDISFTEVLTLPVDGMQLETLNRDELDAALFALHLIGGISYYKTCLPKTIVIKSGTLNQQQANFWKTVYENGLGEFFYRNDINFLHLIDFPFTKIQRRQDAAVRRSDKRETSGRILVPMGGGKDSIVTAQLLRAGADNVTLMRMGSHPIIDDIAQIAGLPLLTIKRQLSPELFEMNKQGALNGHVPITAYLSFVTIVMSILYGFDTVAMSNEGSASEGNVSFHGRDINHQWSKGMHFERILRDYTAKWITPHMEYFSFLRPMTELQVTKLFCNYPLFFRSFTSCNANWKILETDWLANRSAAPESSTKAHMDHSYVGQTQMRGGWCGHCPKCAFVFALLAAFLLKNTMIDIFEKDLFADETLLPVYRELLGLQHHKPFECVGTPDETKAAFLLAYNRKEFAISAAMTMFKTEVLTTIEDPKKLIDESLTISDLHFIPEKYIPLLPKDSCV